MTVPLDQRPHSGPYSGLTVNSLKRFLTTQFQEAGVETPDLDARLLVMAATGLTHTELIISGRDFPPAATFDIIADYANRRLAGEPIDHILGYREFYGRRFKVTKDVLSPRPETELLIEAALENLRGKTGAKILDLGTGSGAIAISILTEENDAQGLAIDMSGAALDIAKENAAQHNVADRLKVLQGSWFEAVTEHFDIILSNPPYITDAAMKHLAPEVTGFDPDIALRGGADGLAAYKEIISNAPQYLKPNGIILLEIGYDQGPSVTDLLERRNFSDITTSQDLSGHDRMIKAAYKA
ncbi:peptide chain release factor N(5)-glutamine methyltransferase [Hellea balneolensis]|uniref:peptide chain release factor N(5)-glutamine methyltransferase n=1 Tax=Hellea balneolensis TaxID=287478 RepID=UPI00040FFF08|nr:peptide chain release factor N(5)-glutamine methyltransferase [Hellea balneolensis]